MARRMAVLLVGVLAAASAWASGGAEAGAAPQAGTISYLDGEVSLDGREASVGDNVPRGATLRTGPASVCEIIWGGENLIQLQEGTLAVLDMGGGVPGVRLEAGAMAAVLNRVDAISRRGTFRVRTPSVAAGVRGTVFFVKVEDPKNTYICACFGALGIAAVPGGELASAQHKARRFSGSGLAARSAPAALLYHDSQSMQALATKIGYTIPWGQGEYASGGSGESGY